MKDVSGAIDGTHLRIVGQTFANECYINRKGYPSIILQAVCDHRMMFTDCYIGWPGSVHDSRVLENSDLKSRIDNDREKMFPDNTYLVGDGGYPLRPYMMTPYKDFGHLSKKQSHYNFVQSSTRNIIERVFGVLKAKFPRLRLLDMKSITDICHYVL